MARQLVANKWSLKQTLEFLLTSEAFQRSSLASPMALEKDPANQLLSHINVRRLDAEPNTPRNARGTVSPGRL